MRGLLGFELSLAAALVPLYWIMMAIAAAKATWQLIAQPSYWEKTTHGLLGADQAEPDAAGASAQTPA